MSRALLALMALLIAVPIAAARPVATSTRLRVTGEISKLGVTNIAIGHVTCKIPAKVRSNAGRFVIGDPVKMTCVNGSLTNIKYSPEVASGQTSARVPFTPVTPKSPADLASLASGSAHVVAWNFGTITFPSSAEQAPTTTASGTVTDFYGDGITVTGLNCSISATAYKVIGPFIHIGDRISITCRTDTGQLTAGKSIS